MKIEKNVAIPLCGDGTRLGSKYPFNKMVPGDSVFVEGQNTTGKAYAAAKSMGVQRGWKFSGRTVGGGVRIWRVE